MTEITFDQGKGGDRIKAREVYKNGDTFEGEFTVTVKDVNTACVYSGYHVFHKIHSDRESLTFERVQMPEPKKIGTVVEYMHGGDLATAVLYSAKADNPYPWILPSGYTRTWGEILSYDPNPKIKED